jgi:hypothetical protein
MNSAVSNSLGAIERDIGDQVETSEVDADPVYPPFARIPVALRNKINKEGIVDSVNWKMHIVEIMGIRWWRVVKGGEGWWRVVKGGEGWWRVVKGGEGWW